MTASSVGGQRLLKFSVSPLGANCTLGARKGWTPCRQPTSSTARIFVLVLQLVIATSAHQRVNAHQLPPANIITKQPHHCEPVPPFLLLPSAVFLPWKSCGLWRSTHSWKQTRRMQTHPTSLRSQPVRLCICTQHR